MNGSMSTTDWTRGVVDLGVSADDNSGICNVVAEVEGIERRADPQPRDNFSTKPCADFSKRYLWDTSGWPDGEHRVKVDVSDAADRKGRRAAGAGIRSGPTTTHRPVPATCRSTAVRAGRR